jgi:hypothetical protein
MMKRVIPLSTGPWTLNIDFYNLKSKFTKRLQGAKGGLSLAQSAGGVREHGTLDTSGKPVDAVAPVRRRRMKVSDAFVRVFLYAICGHRAIGINPEP